MHLTIDRLIVQQMFYGKTGSAFEDLPFSNIFTPVPCELQIFFLFYARSTLLGQSQILTSKPRPRNGKFSWRKSNCKSQFTFVQVSSQVVVRSIIVYTAMWPWQCDFFGNLSGCSICFQLECYSAVIT